MSDIVMTVAENIDAGLRIAHNLDRIEPVDIGFGYNLREIGKPVLAIGIGIGAVGAVASEMIVGTIHIVNAQEVCYEKDLSGNYEQVPCPPTTVEPNPVDNNPQPEVTVKPSSSGSRNSPTTTVGTFVKDVDGDGYKVIVRADNGAVINYGFEVDDGSKGKGDAGIKELEKAFSDRGLDMYADPDLSGLYSIIGASVAPDNWPEYIEILNTTELTTTTSTTTTTTTSEPSTTTIVSAPPDREPIVITVETPENTQNTETTDSTTVKAVAITNNINSNSGFIERNRNKSGLVFLGALLGGLVLVGARRRQQSENSTDLTSKQHLEGK